MPHGDLGRHMLESIQTLCPSLRQYSATNASVSWGLPLPTPSLPLQKPPHPPKTFVGTQNFEDRQLGCVWIQVSDCWGKKSLRGWDFIFVLTYSHFSHAVPFFTGEASQYACPVHWGRVGHHEWEQMGGWRGNLFLSCCGHPQEMQGALGGAVPTAQGSGGGQGCFAVI